MHNGNTKTSLAIGSEWSDTRLRDGWGEVFDENFNFVKADADDRGDEVLDLVHEACEALGRDDICWLPTVSEVHGYAACDPNARGQCFAGVDGGTPGIHLETLRESCLEVVSQCHGLGEEPVGEALGDLQQFVIQQPELCQ